MDGLADPSRRRFLTGRPVPGDATPPRAAPVAAVGDGCLPIRGIDCQICRDACAPGAIRFRPRRGGPFLPEVRSDACTGCGTCVAACPTGAMGLGPPAEGTDA